MMTEPSNADRFAIRLFACLLILGGVDAAAEMVDSLRHGVEVNGAVLGIFIGKGLLQYREIWRKWAVFAAWLGIIAAPIGVVVVTFRGPAEPVHVFDINTGVWLPWYAMASLFVPCFAFCLWQRHVLTRERVKLVFRSREKKGDSWWAVVLVVATLISVSHCVQRYLLHHWAESLGHYQATIHAVDADMGEHLNSLSYSLPGSGDGILPKLRTKTQARKLNDGEGKVVSLTVFWMAISPVVVEVSAPGYAEKKISLTPDADGDSLRVELRRQ
jgi:hypothetical protein